MYDYKTRKLFEGSLNRAGTQSEGEAGHHDIENGKSGIEDPYRSEQTINGSDEVIKYALSVWKILSQ